MKKIITLLFLIISIYSSQAQEIQDAVRFSQDNLTGSARFRAMSGAFGALGGDLSSINVNPAGSAIFTTNSLGFTLSNYNRSNKSRYFGARNTMDDHTFDLNQAGIAFVFNSTKENNPWRKFSVAVNYENQNNFDDAIFSSGTNPTSSIADYFLSFANQNGGVPLDVLENANYEELNFADAQALLGYQGFLINPVENDPDNSAYVSNVPAGGNLYQEYSMVSTGYNGKLTFNGAAQYRDKLYLGLNINTHFTDYRQVRSFFERNENNPEEQLQRTRFNTNLHTYGSGFSFQLGAIAKVTEAFRVGLAYESPTWYSLTDEVSQSISSVVAEETQPVVFDPAVTVVYQPYTLQTPGKVTGSMAYIFGKSSLLSIDYSIKDYGTTKFSPNDDPYFIGLNSAMADQLGKSGELRIGAEHRIKQWSLRAGFRNEQSPYRDGRAVGDLTGYSGGLGYNFGRTRLDLAYSYFKRDTNSSFFSQGFTAAPTINSVNNNVSLSLIFEL